MSARIDDGANERGREFREFKEFKEFREFREFRDIAHCRSRV